MGLKASIKKRWVKIVSRLLKRFGRFFSRYPFVEIFSIHLGHTVIESAYLMQHRPLVIFWRTPIANKWLVRKLENSVRFPKIQKWITERQSNGESEWLISAVRKASINFSDQYFLLNLGFNLLPRKAPSISFTDEEVREAEKFLHKHGLKKQKFVCFCVRDETYYKEFKPDLNFGGTENFEFRNANIKHYIKAAMLLKGKGITPVLMGFSTQSAPETFLRPGLFAEFRPWIEAYLLRECLFTVGMMTGTTLYASLFGRPVLWSDIFWRGTPIGGRQDLVLPKKILQGIPSDSKNNKASWNEVTMKKWVQLGPPPDNDWSHFAKRGYECKSCSPDEILDAVKDMLSSLETNKMFPNQRARALHKKFSALHLRASKKLGCPPTRLAPSWANANCDLLENSSVNYNKYWVRGFDKENMDMIELIASRQSKMMFNPKSRR